MKRLLLLPLLMLVVIANAKNYYVSATGNDSNTGTTPTAAWKSLTKVNSFVFAANDSILFSRGDIFYGSIIVNRNNLFFSAYGTGAKPLITGFTAASSWKSLGGGIYEAVVNAKSTLNMVAVNGRPQQIGRYPNASDANGGYLTFDAATTNSITDNQLSTTVNWTGAEVAIRKNGWTIDRCIVTGQTGGTINYRIGRSINSGSQPVLSTAKLGHGYFFMDDVRTLDQFGEWYFDTTAKKIKIYFGSSLPADYSVQVSTVDTLFNIGSRTNINVSNIGFDGANMSGIFAIRSSYVTIQNCDLRNMGAKAIHIFETPNVLIENVNTNNVLSNAIQVLNRNFANVTVRNCIVMNTSPFPGMGSYYDDTDNKGVYLTVTNNLLAEYNVIDSVGLAGLQFNGNDIVIKNNKISGFCRILHDNAGIYTYAGGTDANPGSFFTNRTISNNIIMNGVGAPFGTNSSAPFLAGIYLDGRTMNVNVVNNTIFNMPKNGIHCNNPSNITIRGNTFFNNLRDISFMRWAWGSISKLNVKGNISFPMSADQKNIYYVNGGLNSPVTTTLQANLKSLGSFDSNYYHSFTDAGIATEIYTTDGGALIQTTPFSLDAWKSFTSYDRISQKPAQKIQPYTITATIGSNLFPNSQFTSNINNTTAFGSGTTATWDNTSKITGTGSLRMDFAAPAANKYSFIHSPIGPVSSSKKYALRFATRGTKVGGIVRAYLRKSASPYNNLVPTQAKSFDMSKINHEFLFEAPITETASFVIEVEQTSGTTYIDDIEFVEVNATVNSLESQVKFLYNDTKLAKTISLDAKYIGVDSTVYNGSITLAPYSSRVIVKAGPVSGTLPVELLDFSAKNINEKAVIKWITTGEINSSHYLVERSADSRQFESIGNVASNNRADIQSIYNFTDDMPLNGVVYYRLAMVDKDGSINYSKIVSITIKNTGKFVINNVKVSSRNSNVKINISSSYQTQKLSFAVVDASGRIITSKNMQLLQGNNDIITDIPAINRGIYYVKMQIGYVTVTKAVISE